MKSQLDEALLAGVCALEEWVLLSESHNDAFCVWSRWQTKDSP